MKHKIQQVMMDRENSKPLSLYIKIDDANWGGKKHDGGKRGRGAATGKIPFVATVSTNSQRHPFAIRFSQISSLSKEAISIWARKHLDPTCVVVSDGLSCFSAIKGCGHEHTANIASGGPDSVKIQEFEWVNTIIGKIKMSSTALFTRSAKNIFLVTLASSVTGLIVGMIWQASYQILDI